MVTIIFSTTLLHTTTIFATSLAPLVATMNLWYAIPLVVSVSLVCAATRQEDMLAIMNHAFRFAIWIVIFMGIVMAVLALLSWWASLG